MGRRRPAASVHSLQTQTLVTYTSGLPISITFIGHIAAMGLVRGAGKPDIGKSIESACLFEALLSPEGFPAGFSELWLDST